MGEHVSLKVGAMETPEGGIIYVLSQSDGNEIQIPGHLVPAVFGQLWHLQGEIAKKKDKSETIVQPGAAAIRQYGGGH